MTNNSNVKHKFEYEFKLKKIVAMYLEIAEKKAEENTKGNHDPDNYCREVLENLKDLIK